MQRWFRPFLMFFITLLALWSHTTTQAEETLLRWKNGDSLSGQLMDSKAGMIRWKSPYFADDLSVSMDMLDSIVFSKQPTPVTGAFRVGTVTGDFWTADIIDSDEDTFLFSNNRYGKFRVNRNMIYSLENRDHANLIFDGSQLSSWVSTEQETTKNQKTQTNKNQSGWYPEQNGTPRTDRSKTSLFYPLKWPNHYEIDFELASTSSPPGFVFALGKNLYQALRVETWAKEVVVVQGTLYEPILKIKPDHRNYRFRLAYDQDTKVLKVFDENGNLLLKLDEVQQTTELPGVYIYNRGQDLTLRRLRVYHQLSDIKEQQIDFTKPRVHMMNGQVFHGKLFVKDGTAYIHDTDNKRSDVNLEQVDRVVLPGRKLTKVDHSMVLSYIDGSIVSGQVQQLNTDSAIMQTLFADEPITCSLDGVSELHLESGAKSRQPIDAYDRMFFPTGILRGEVIFDSDEQANIKWLPIGASEPVRVANNLSPRIERNNKRVSRLHQFDVKTFPHLLHLKNGEVIPCQVISYDQDRTNLVSPFVKTTHIDSEHIKGIEFSRGKTHARKENRNPITITGGNKHRIILEDGRILEGMMQRNEAGHIVVQVDTGNPHEELSIIFSGRNINDNDAVALKRAVEVMFDPLETQSDKLDVKLERALTVPRFNRENPPEHILEAKNGDMKRGNLVSFNGKTIQFNSGLQNLEIPIDRVARIVNISTNDSENELDEQNNNDEDLQTQQKPDSKETETFEHAEKTLGSTVRFALIHNPILIFEPLKVKDDRLLGHSQIYGEVSVPMNSIQYIHFGEKAKSFKSVFENWIARPAKEPDFGSDR